VDVRWRVIAEVDHDDDSTDVCEARHAPSLCGTRSPAHET
jgi:hypothetical protein